MDITISNSHVVRVSGDGIPSQTSNSVEAVLLYEILQILKAAQRSAQTTEPNENNKFEYRCDDYGEAKGRQTLAPTDEVWDCEFCGEPRNDAEARECRQCHTPRR